MTLGAFAQPSTHRYFTRPLSNLKITVVKQYERVDLNSNEAANAALHCSVSLEYKIPKVADASQIYSNNDSHQSCYSSFAGCGVVTVKRNVHGYKKLSLVTREEISRSELSLPDMEYDTFAFWLDCDAKVFGSTMTEQDFGHGVHALSHAILAVAPLFVPCVVRHFCVNCSSMLLSLSLLLIIMFFADFSF
jgi:DEAD/DEAH box helicase domain-containing protein